MGCSCTIHYTWYFERKAVDMTAIIKRDRYFSISITLMTISFLLVFGGITIHTFISEELGPANPSCVELGNCDLWTSPLSAMMQPFIDVFGPITYVIIWGIIIGVIWLRTHNILLVGAIGTLIAGFLTYQGLNSINPQILLVGATLIAVSIACVLYQLIFQRLQYSSS